MQQHWRRVVRILSLAAVGMNKVAPRELLDQDLIGGDFRVQGCDSAAQHILHVDINFGLNAFGTEVMAGEVFTLPLPMHHLQALGMLEAVIGLDAGRWKFLKEM